MDKKSAEAVKKAVEYAGGKQALAEKVGVSYKTILDWTSGRSGVSIPNALKIEKATDGNVKVDEILPNFNWNELKLTIGLEIKS